VSGAEWTLETSLVDWEQYQLRNRRNDKLLGVDALAAEGVPVSFEPAEGCKAYPELTLDATGDDHAKTMFDDGDLYGIVDTHSHVHSNYAFGGGGLFHGGAFHRLGVEHALHDCSISHGEMGRKDFFGYIFDRRQRATRTSAACCRTCWPSELPMDNHATAGYPDFTEWPNGPKRSTHQTQYYLWLQRAYLAGLRLEVQHATTNAIICDFMIGEGIQKSRYGCDDMTAVDRIIDETYAMERYIDAQAGGPGLGWFRVVHTPAEAREVIAGGKLAVILGIETSNLFDCKLTPGRATRPATRPTWSRSSIITMTSGCGPSSRCTSTTTSSRPATATGPSSSSATSPTAATGRTSRWTARIRRSAGSTAATSTSAASTCRATCTTPRRRSTTATSTAPLDTTTMYLAEIGMPPLVGPYCQNATLTPLGEHMITQMMARGMIIEVDHLPQWSYVRAYELLQEPKYPASGSHGRNNDGLLYELGGVSTTGFGVCRGAQPGATVQGFKDKIDFIMDKGGYPAEGFGFDLNGFAGARGPRFGDGVCPAPQADPITYPFASYAGDIELTQPVVGNRDARLQQRGARAHRPAARADRGRSARRGRRGGPRAAVPLGGGVYPDVGAGRAAGGSELGGVSDATVERLRAIPAADVAGTIVGAWSEGDAWHAVATTRSGELLAGPLASPLAPVAAAGPDVHVCAIGQPGGWLGIEGRRHCSTARALTHVDGAFRVAELTRLREGLVVDVGPGRGHGVTLLDGDASQFRGRGALDFDLHARDRLFTAQRDPAAPVEVAQARDSSLVLGARALPLTGERVAVWGSLGSDLLILGPDLRRLDEPGLLQRTLSPFGRFRSSAKSTFDQVCYFTLLAASLAWLLVLATYRGTDRRAGHRRAAALMVVLFVVGAAGFYKVLAWL
jgi:hypothetical protein